jgi:hypothetical protein
LPDAQRLPALRSLDGEEGIPDAFIINQQNNLTQQINPEFTLIDVD